MTIIVNIDLGYEFDVKASTDEVFDVLAVDDQHFQAGLFHHLIGAEPLHAGGLHRHHATRGYAREPGGERLGCIANLNGRRA